MKRQLNLTEEQKATILGDVPPQAEPSELDRLNARLAELKEQVRIQEEISSLEHRLLIGSHSLIVLARTAVETVSSHFKVPAIIITGRCREEHIAWPRQVAYHLMKEISQDTLSAIGRVFQRDHGTILAGIRHVKDRCELEPQTAKEVAMLLETCQRRLSTLNPQPSTAPKQ